MSIHTQCLSVFILIFTLNPMSITQFVNFIIMGTSKNLRKNQFLKIMFSVYCVSILCIALINPVLFEIKAPKNIYWYMIAIFIAPIIIIFEILLVYTIMKLRGKNVGGIEILSQWKKVGMGAAFFTVSIGVLEEVIYRLVWFNVLINILQINIIIVIFISALFYAFNHVALGKYVFIQKILSGCIFGMLYYFSGNSIIIPVIAHALQNVIVIIKGGE